MAQSAFLLTQGHGIDGVQQAVLLHRVLDQGVDEQAVRLTMDVLHHDLEAIEEARLGILHLVEEVLGEVLVHDTIAGGEEGQDVFDEVAFVVVELLGPIHQVGVQVDLLGGPEAGLMLLVEVPDVVVLDGEDDETVLVLLQQGLMRIGRVGGKEFLHAHLGRLVGCAHGYDRGKRGTVGEGPVQKTA
jgi:hypothetical protein